MIQRFSEDIDLAVMAPELGDSARKRLLKNVEAAVSKGFVYVGNDRRESKGSRYRKTVYRYPRTSAETNFGQASPELLIEVNAFTRPEPCERKELRTVIADVLSGKEEKTLMDQYGLGSFSVNVLSAERTLIEKMLGAIKDSYSDNPEDTLSSRIRHLHDICLILRKKEYRDFVQSAEFGLLCTRCIEDEKAGFFKYSDCLEKPLSRAPLFSSFSKWQRALSRIYKGPFADLVYGEQPEISELFEALDYLRKNL